MPPRPLTNFEIQKYYRKEPRNILPKIKDEAYVINLEEYSDFGLLCMCEIIALLILILLM